MLHSTNNLDHIMRFIVRRSSYLLLFFIFAGDFCHCQREKELVFSILVVISLVGTISGNL